MTDMVWWWPFLASFLAALCAAVSYQLGVADRRKRALLRTGDRLRLGGQTVVLTGARRCAFQDGDAFVLTVRAVSPTPSEREA